MTDTVAAFTGILGEIAVVVVGAFVLSVLLAATREMWGPLWRFFAWSCGRVCCYLAAMFAFRLIPRELTRYDLDGLEHERLMRVSREERERTEREARLARERRHRAAQDVSARPVPAMSNAVPWSGLVRGMGRPTVMLTARSHAIVLRGIRP